MTRSQVRGLFYLCILLIVGVGSAVVYHLVHFQPVATLPEDSVFVPEVGFKADSTRARRFYGQRRKYPPRKRYTPPPYSSPGVRPGAPASFAFDPNTADSTALLALGLSPAQVRNIYKYRAKGGQYHTKEDFHRLYGLTVGQWRHLEPLIEIGEEYQYVTPLPRDTTRFRRDTTLYPVKYTEVQTIPLNRCDTTDLKRIPGIGRGYAYMIIAYRERLGGYVSLDQLAEIEDLPRELLAELPKWLVVEPSLVRPINLNQLSLTQLRRHPYLNFYQARVIADWRRQNGNLRSLADLRLYDEFTERDFARLTPYVTF